MTPPHELRPELSDPPADLAALSESVREMITTTDKIAAVSAYRGFLARPGRHPRDPRLFAVQNVEGIGDALHVTGYWIDDDQRTRTIAITADELDHLYRDALYAVANARTVVQAEGIRGRMR